MNIISWAAAVSLILTATPSAPKRDLPDNNLAYAVLLATDEDFGTGFHIDSSKGLLLVTAKHNLYSLEKPDQEPELRTKQVTVIAPRKDPPCKTRELYRVDIVASERAGHLFPSTSADVVVVRVGRTAIYQGKSKWWLLPQSTKSDPAE